VSSILIAPTPLQNYKLQIT